MTVTDNSWVTPGAKGAIVNTSGWGHGRIVKAEVTVTRVGKRDVAVMFPRHDGICVERKFRLADLHEQGHERYRADCLLPLGDQRLADIAAADAAIKRENAARATCEDFNLNRNRETADAAIAALTAYRDAYDENV